MGYSDSLLLNGAYLNSSLKPLYFLGTCMSHALFSWDEESPLWSVNDLSSCLSVCEVCILGYGLEMWEQVVLDCALPYSLALQLV